MNKKPFKWAVALIASLTLHAGAGGYIMTRSDDIQIAGGGETEISIAGDAFSDMMAAGEIADEIDPVSEETPDEVVPETATEVTPEAPVEETVAPETVETEMETVETEITPVTDNVVEPVEEVEQAAAVVEVPVPSRRPAYTPPKRVERKEVEKPKQVARKEPPRKHSSGSRGNDRQNARRGTANGGAKGAVSNGGRQSARASQAGNARVSNYPGKVVAKLRRARRYPSEAKRERLRGQVRVSFTITSNGGVSSLRVSRSSGSSILDRAALETVRRAAPFPPIPDGAGRASWPFTVPIDFSTR